MFRREWMCFLLVLIRSCCCIIPLLLCSQEETSATDSWDRREQQTEEQTRRDDARAQLEEERNPSRSCLHQFFRCISVATGTCALLMGLGQVVGMTFEDIDVISYVMRGYVMVLCVLVIFIEAEWTALVKNSSILRYWISRGLFYSFVGVIGLQQNDHATERDPDTNRDSVSLHFIKVVAWLMIASGILYFGMGVLCLQIYYNRLRRTYEERCGRAVHVRDATERLTEVGEMA